MTSYAFAGVAAAAFVSMLALFAWTSLPAWRSAGTGYLFDTEWFYRDEAFGTASMLFGTLAVALVALVLAAPIGVGAAVCTAELLKPRGRLAAKATIELLAGVPSVVYGLLGVLFLRVWVFDGLVALGLEPWSGDSLLTAGLLLFVMVLPTVMTLADDALRAVPGTQRLAARAAGLTRVETVLFVTLPQARRGIAAALLLGLGRALGETIAVFLVIGRQDNQWPGEVGFLGALLAPGQTLASKLGGAEPNIAYGDPLHFGALVGLGLLLLLVAALLTVAASRLARRSRA